MYTIIIDYRLKGIIERYNFVENTIIEPPISDTPNPDERVPVQHDTDLGYIKRIAERYGYVFYIDSKYQGADAFHDEPYVIDSAYWGPPQRSGLPQKALSVNRGYSSNVEKIDFSYDALEPITVSGLLQDAKTNQAVSVNAFTSNRTPLSGTGSYGRTGSVLLEGGQGFEHQQALAKAQAMVDVSRDNVVVATGTLDYTRYRRVLKARALVRVDGAGSGFNGSYYVKQITHILKPLEERYQQEFKLVRDAL